MKIPMAIGFAAFPLPNPPHKGEGVVLCLPRLLGNANGNSAGAATLSLPLVGRVARRVGRGFPCR
jgi:hypothetical protein